MTTDSTEQVPTKEQVVKFLKEQIEVKELQATLQKLNTAIAVGRADELEAFAKIAHYSKKEPEMIKHVVIQEDLDNNPGLSEQGIKLGDEIGIPEEAYQAFLKPEVSETPKQSTPSLSIVD